MGSAFASDHRAGGYVKIDESRKRELNGSLGFRKSTGVDAALQRHNYGYAVRIGRRRQSVWRSSTYRAFLYSSSQKSYSCVVGSLENR